MKYSYNGSELHKKGESTPPAPSPVPDPKKSFGLGNLFQRNQVTPVSPVTGGVAAPNMGVPAQAGAPIPVTTESVVAYLSPSPAEVNQLYGYVVSSPMVVENIRYAQCMEGVPFLYDQANDVVNATARRAQSAPDPKNGGRVTLSFDTVIYGGALRYSRLIGIGVAWENAGHRGSLARLLAAMSPQLTAACSVEACLNLITQCGLLPALGDDAVRQKAVSYSSGMIVSVLAHEVGHHVLGHLMSFSPRENLEVERNQEREADSFASSVISCSPFSEYTFAGTLFWHYALAVLTDEGSDTHRSHPLSRERFQNFVRNNRAAAAAFGISMQ